MERLRPLAGPNTTTPVTVTLANEAFWEDLRAVFGDRGYAAYCQCQKWKFESWA